MSAVLRTTIREGSTPRNSRTGIVDTLTQSIPKPVLSAEAIGDPESSERDEEPADQDEDFGIHHQEFADPHRAIPLRSWKRSPAARAILNTPRGPFLR
jgi:hypothetical protein